MSFAPSFLLRKEDRLPRSSGGSCGAATRFFIYTAACTLLPLLLLCSASLARARQQERVLRMESEIQINADTTLAVKERIKVLSAGDKVKRGIIREFPAWFNDDINYKVNVHYLDFEVTRDGKPEAFSFQLEGDSYRLYIGEPHTELAPGEHTYQITYNVLRKLQYFNTYDLLLWNVTGSSWGLPVDAISATASLPRLTRPILRYSAAINGQGTNDIDFDVCFPQKGRAVFTLLRPLQPNEDFSIAVAWPKGLVNEPTALEYYENN